jgi:hypothetical protein
VTGRLVSVNVGRPRAVDTGRRIVETAIFKEPVEGPVAVRGVNLDGDDQADRTVHGGPDKAVYAYGIEDTRAWAGALERPLGPGAFGENLTTEGVDVTRARPVTGRIGHDAAPRSVQPRWPVLQDRREVSATRVRQALRQAGGRARTCDRRGGRRWGPATPSRSSTGPTTNLVRS